MTKPRVRYRDGVGFFRIHHYNAGFAVYLCGKIKTFDDWRTFTVGPFDTLTDALASSNPIPLPRGPLDASPPSER